MKKLIFYIGISLIFISGCTSLITAPMRVAGTSVGTVIHDGSSANRP